MTSLVAQNAWTSVTVFARQMIELYAPEAQLIDWEAFSSIQELPATDLIGPASFGIDERSPEIFDVVFTIGVSTFDDTSLFRHRKLMAQIFEELRPTKTLTVFDAETARPYSWMKIVNGTSLAPVANAQTRAFQFIQAQGLLDPLAGASVE